MVVVARVEGPIFIARSALWYVGTAINVELTIGYVDLPTCFLRVNPLILGSSQNQIIPKAETMTSATATGGKTDGVAAVGM